jgi:hypothetical protein
MVIVVRSNSAAELTHPPPGVLGVFAVAHGATDFEFEDATGVAMPRSP